MKYDIRTNGNGAILHVQEELTLSDQSTFHALIPKLLEQGAQTVTVDMHGLRYMDSAGLGMLLTLREQAERQNAVVVIARPEGEVQEMLKLACFDTLFNVKENL